MRTRSVQVAISASGAALLLLSAAAATRASAGDPALDPPPAGSISDLLDAGPPLQHTTSQHPAPPSQTAPATASGLRVIPLGVCASCSSANAGSTNGTAGATALSVLGRDLAGGSSSGTGSRGGAVVAVPANPILSLAVGQWLAETRPHRSHARTALIALVLLPRGYDSGGTATISVVDAESEDTTTAPGPATDTRKTEHHGRSSGDAASVDVANGQTTADVAHSEASSDGTGKAYAAGVGKQEVISSQQSGEEIPIRIPGVDVIAVHRDPDDVENTRSDVVRADDTAAQPAEPAPVADAVTASAASAPTQSKSPAASVPEATPVTGGATRVLGVGVPTTGTALAGAGALLSLAGGAVTVWSIRPRRSR